MKWEKYTLSQQVEVQDSIGQFMTSWESLGEIDVVVSNTLYTTVTGDNVYRVFSPSGITKYKALEADCTYKIANGTDEYVITSFNTAGRFTQLLLQKVVTNG